MHLTAVPAPGIVPDHLTFMNNIACSWNVVSAGALMGVLTVVAAAEEVLVKGTRLTHAAALVLLAAAALAAIG